MVLTSRSRDLNCLKSSSKGAKSLTPVMLPSVLSKAVTNLALTGSVIPARTIGIFVVACCKDCATGVVIAKIKSGSLATTSSEML